MLRKIIAVVGLIALGVLGITTDLRSDILFRNKQPWKIGHGKQVGSKITWTDCSGNNEKTYDQPPYSLDQADNCTVGPPAFGLQCDGEICTVVDQDKLSKYIPGARNGDRASLKITPQLVELTYGKSKIVLER
jgi:hypothetical protein